MADSVFSRISAWFFRALLATDGEDCGLCGVGRGSPPRITIWQPPACPYNTAPIGEELMRNVLWCVAVAAVVSGAFWIGRLSADEKPKMRFFEMRTYTAAEGKLDALNARF